MINSTTKRSKSSFVIKDYLIYSFISLVIILGLWTLLSFTIAKESKVILNPLDTLIGIIAESKKKTFWTAIGSTLNKSFVSFIISFLVAFSLAVLGSFSKIVKKIVNPIISIFRSIPTAAIILILLICVGSKVLPFAVAILVVLPLSYQNIITSIEDVDKNLIQMSNVFGISRKRQLLNIYVPSILPSLLSSIIASFGLNIKVIIAAEVMGLPSVSIGYMILISKQGFEFDIAFVWLVIAVLLSMICELILKVISRLLLPYKFDDLNKLKKLFKKMRRQK